VAGLVWSYLVGYQFGSDLLPVFLGVNEDDVADHLKDIGATYSLIRFLLLLLDTCMNKINNEGTARLMFRDLMMCFSTVLSDKLMGDGI